MEIIISANELILNMAKKGKIEVDENMSEEDFFSWTQGIAKDVSENGLQEI